MRIGPISGVRDVKQAPPLNLRCPECRRDVTFESLGWHDIQMVTPGGYVYAGQRKCGNPVCRSHLFVVLDGDHSVLTSYPPETLDFDATDIPPKVVAAFEEAIKCHAQQCYVASAIMVRKTLEELCADREATDNTLHDKIESLGKLVILPPAFLVGLHDLRLLGNDAAHLESRVYEDIGQEEVEVAVAVTKEVLKATYQYDGIMGSLAALKAKRQADEQ
jgi:hypothetical protein